MRGLGLSAQQASDFLDRLVPTVEVGDLTHFTESDTFFERPAIYELGTGGVAAQVSSCQLFNPAGSGVDVLLELVHVLVENAGNIDMRVHNTALTNLGTAKVFRDRRITGSPAAEPRAVTQVGAIGTLVGIVAVAAAPSEVLALDILLPPGTGFHLDHQTVDTDLTCTWFATETSRE